MKRHSVTRTYESVRKKSQSKSVFKSQVPSLKVLHSSVVSLRSRTRTSSVVRKVERLVVLGNGVIDPTQDSDKKQNQGTLVDLTGDADNEGELCALEKPRLFPIEFGGADLLNLDILLNGKPGCNNLHEKLAQLLPLLYSRRNGKDQISECESLSEVIRQEFMAKKKQIVSISNNPVSANLIATLLDPTSWLTDEVINAFMASMQLLFPRIKFFNTYFYSTLTNKKMNKSGYNYDGVRRWTKRQTRAGIFEFDWVVIPINKGNVHWCMAFINLSDFEEYSICFLDSMHGPSMFSNQVTRALKRYLHDEWTNKAFPIQSKESSSKNPVIPIPRIKLMDGTPLCSKQADGNSCGVFVCHFARCVAVGRELWKESFSQRDADAFRRRLACILTLPVLTIL